MVKIALFTIRTSYSCEQSASGDKYAIVIPNIYFINSNNEVFESDKIKNIYTEKNGIWNDTDIWKQCIDDTILKIKNDNLHL